MTSTERLPLKSRLLRASTWLVLGSGAVTGGVIGYQHERDATEELRQEIRIMRSETGGFLEIGEYVTNIRTRPPTPDEAPILNRIETLSNQAEEHDKNSGLLILGFSATAGTTLIGAGYELLRRPTAQPSQ